MTDRAARVPRGTCRIFGAIKAGGTIQNCLILVHGPRGCVYHINYILGLRGDHHIPVYSTSLDEHDVIFGAEEKLREAIEELDTLKSPEIILVLSCCASSIIGEDINGAIARAHARSVVIGIDAGGFAGDYTTGYAETLRRVVETCSRPVPGTIPRSVNLLGVLRSGPDLREVRRLLSLAGISVISALPAGASLETMRKMGAAALNVVICETSGLEAARYLEERFGTPYLVTDFPIGPDESRAWLQGVARAMSIKFAVPADSFPALPPVRVRERRIAIFSGPTRAVAVARFLSGLGVSPRLIVLDFPPPDPAKVAAAAGPSCEVLVSPDWDEIVERVQELGIDLLIGGMMESPLAARFGIPLLDIMHGSQRSAGAQGAGLLLSFLQEGPGKKS